MQYYGLTNVGKVRLINEDSFAVKMTADGVFAAIVADGMGGHQAGEEASNCAVTMFINLIEEASKYFYKYSDSQIAGFLKNAVNKINKKIYALSCEVKQLSGMGTTIVCCIIYRGKYYVANVGDSRLYRYSDIFEQVTIDHSYVAELVNMGVITKEEAKNHPNKNVITRAVGTEKTVVPDIFINKINPGDKLLLCSDGLTNMVSDESLSDAITLNNDIEKITTNLVELANMQGGTDNITVVLLKAESEGDYSYDR